MTTVLIVGLSLALIWALIMCRVLLERGRREGIHYGVHRMTRELTDDSGDTAKIARRLGWVKLP
jgi:hypothetical protein